MVIGCFNAIGFIRKVQCVFWINGGAFGGLFSTSKKRKMKKRNWSQPLTTYRVKNGKAEVVKRYFCSSVSILAPHQPVKVLPTSTISEVLQILRKSKIGSVLVSGENRDFGIFTERDYVKKVLGSERDLSKDPVSDFMSSPLVGIADDLSVLDAYQKLSGKSIRHLPVVGKDGRVSSMLSVKDFMDTLAQGIVAELEQKKKKKK